MSSLPATATGAYIDAPGLARLIRVAARPVPTFGSSGQFLVRAQDIRSANVDASVRSGALS